MKYIYTIIFLLCTLGPISSLAKEYKVEEVPMVHLADRTRYVSNPDNILSASTVNEIDRMMYSLEQKTGIQVAVVVVEQIYGGDCMDFAYNLGRTNGVDQKGKDNGLVVLLSTVDRCIQFSTGYGLEGVLPDAICKKIQVRYMNKAFSKGDWDTGMLAGMEAVHNILINENGTPDNPLKGKDAGTLLFALFGVLSITMIFLWISIRRRNRCPKCHKHTLKVISTQTIEKNSSYQIDEVVSCCTNCGHIVRRQTRTDRDDDFHSGRRGLGGGIFLGGGFGRGGGGGFGGGSFGGGDFGGGGAGSKF